MAISGNNKRMAISRNSKRKEYARYAAHCLQMVTAASDQELRSVQREMAAEWLKLANDVGRRSKHRQMG
jgi:hypothetical protein